MGIAVGRVAPHGLAKPVDSGLGVALQPVGVSEVEEVVDVLAGNLGRPVEVERREPGLGGCAAAQLHDAEIVVDGGGRPFLDERREDAKGFVETLDRHVRQRRQERGAAPEARRCRNRLDGRQRPLVIALIGVDLPQRQPRPVERGVRLERGVQIIHGGRRRFGEQTLDVILERRTGGWSDGALGFAATLPGGASCAPRRSKIENSSGSGPPSVELL